MSQRKRVVSVLAASLVVVLVAAGACKGDAPKPRAADQNATGPHNAVAAADRAEAEAAAESRTKPGEHSGARVADSDSKPGCAGIAPLASRFPAPERLVAIGDIHGDLAAARAALRLAGAIDEHDAWIGGELVVVQTGDILDRGDDEQDILDMLERVAAEAALAGGAVHVLNGNHETMNAVGDFGYVTPGGFRDFEDVPDLDLDSAGMDDVPRSARARVAAFFPGGPYARVLARHNTAVIVGDSVFAHGGVLPAYASYGLEELNGEIRCWLAGEAPLPKLMDDGDNPMWSRHFSMAPEHCDLLRESLATLGVSRMVVGHTPQENGITSACGDGVWRIDVGLAKFYGGPLQVLEIMGDDVRVLK